MAKSEAKTTADPTPGGAGAEPVLRLERSFAAPRDAVFRAWTEPEALAKWWGPKDFTIPVCEMDVREGGAWRTCMRDKDGVEHWVGGVYREVVAPERLVFTWAWERDGVPGDETQVTVEFRALGEVTGVTLTQRVFESADSRDAHEGGWSSSLDCLRDTLGVGATA